MAFRKGDKRPPTSGKPKGYKAPHTVLKEAARQAFAAYVIEHLPAMLPAQVSAAKGVQHFLLREPNGKFKRVENIEQIEAAMNDEKAVWQIWTRDPNTHAFGYLVDQALDKAAQPQKLLGEDGGPAELVFRWQK